MNSMYTKQNPGGAEASINWSLGTNKFEFHSAQLDEF